MDKDEHLETLEFELCNEKTVERFETSLDLGSKAEEKFGDIVCGGYIARLAKRPMIRVLSEEIRAKGFNNNQITEDQTLKLLLVPHTFSLRPQSGTSLSKLVSVGCIIEFLPGAKSFTIFGLLPNSSFRKILSTEMKGEVSVGLDVAAGAFGIIDGLPDVEASPDLFKFEVNLRASMFATDIAATGVGSEVATFELFSGGARPLHDQDLTVWTAVLVSDAARKLKYKTKLFYTTRQVVLTRRCETAWLEYTVPCR